MEECKHDEYCPLYLSYLGENLDEIKTAEYTVELSDKKLYLLINTAVLEGVTENVNIPDFIIKRIRYYQYDKNLVGKIDCNI